MAKELPFFKFNATEWLTGNISYEDYEVQGYFIRLCAEYWNRNNKLTVDDANKRLRNETILNELTEKNYIKVKRKRIFISFLDEERESINAKRLKLSQAGRKGGLSSASARLKHKEIDKEVEVEEEKEIEEDWRGADIGADGYRKKK